MSASWQYRGHVIGCSALIIAWFADLSTAQSLFAGAPYTDFATAQLASGRFIFLVLGPAIIMGISSFDTDTPSLPNGLLQQELPNSPNEEVTLP